MPARHAGHATPPAVPRATELYGRGVYRFLLSRQWVIVTLIALLLIPVMIELGFWQLHRHQSRVARNEEIAHSLEAPAAPVARLTSPGHKVAHDDMYRTVTATGSYDAEHEVVVRQRTAADGQTIGYYVLIPLVMGDGRVALVNRGWIPAGGDLTKFPKVPAAPSGRVTVTGRLMPDETTRDSGIKDKRGLPPRQVMMIDSRQQARTLREPVLGGYIQLTNTSPKPSGHQPQMVPEPDHSSIGPHMAYTIQWWLFSVGVPIGWTVLVRRERKDRLAAQERETAVPVAAA